MFSCQSIKKTLKRRMRDLRKEGGAIAIIYGVALIPMLGFLGLSIDLGRVYYAHTVLTGAVDFAALSGAKALETNPSGAAQQATAIFNANIPEGFTSWVTVSGPTLTIDNQVASVSATATINTYFMRILGKDTLSISATSQALISNPGTEIVLALDNTGSMSGGPMNSEIQAARRLVEIVYKGQETVPYLSMAVVPYTTTVNIGISGSTPTSWLTTQGVAAVSNTNLYPNISPSGSGLNQNVGGRWMGCIEARTPPLYAAGMDTSELPPTSAATRFTPYLYPSTLIHKYVPGVALDRTDPLRVPPRAESPRWDNDWRLNGTAPSGLQFGQNYTGNTGVGPNLGCPIPIQPLVAEKSKVLATINNMKATFRGGTMINLGLNAAWWAISPSWRGMWHGTPSDLPKDYGATKKFLVLMTDGQNNWYDWPDGLPGLPSTSLPRDADYTGYGRLLEGRSGTTNFNQTATLLNQKMSQMCQTLKSQGVTIYTILFDHGGSAGGPGSSTRLAFENCATEPNAPYYHYAASDADLVNAFENIGESISSLRLTWPGNP